jgi:hypothetical protein
MARAGYCQHGHPWSRGTPEPFEFDGKVIQLPESKCYQCEEEERARRDALEREQTHQLNLVRKNFIKLLDEDKEFKRMLIKMLFEDKDFQHEVGYYASQYKGY